MKNPQGCSIAWKVLQIMQMFFTLIELFFLFKNLSLKGPKWVFWYSHRSTVFGSQCFYDKKNNNFWNLKSFVKVFDVVCVLTFKSPFCSQTCWITISHVICENQWCLGSMTRSVCIYTNTNGCRWQDFQGD